MLNTNTFLSLTHITCVATKSTLWSLDGAALNVIPNCIHAIMRQYVGMILTLH